MRSLETRDVGPLSLRATLQPDTVNREKRTVELVWTTGAKVMRGYFDRFWEELSLDPAHVRLDRLNNGAPFLMDHDGYRVADTPGVVQPGSARLLKTEGRATIRFVRSGVDPEADKLFDKISDGIVQNVSVGYRVHKMEKVEGGDEKIPTYRATDWEPYEISAVAMGADAGAGFRSESAEKLNQCVFVTRGAETVDKIEDPKPAATVAAPAPAAPAIDERAITERAAQAERERISGIRSAARAAKLDEKLADEHVIKGTALDAFRAIVIGALAARSDEVRTEQHVVLEVGETEHQKRIRGMSAWLFERTGSHGPVAQAVELAKNGKLRLGARHAATFRDLDLDGGEFRGMSLLDMARICLEARGVDTRRMSREKLAETALTHRSPGMASTSDFAVLFENVMHKQLLGAYATAPDTWRQFCGVDQVPDYRESNRFRVGSFGTMDVVPEGAEYTSKAIPDGEKKSISTQKYGNMIALTREAIINDDMNANADLAARFGRGFGLTLEAAVYALLAENSGLGPTQSDSNPFFHSTRGNVGTDSTLSVAGLDADRVLMAQQQDISSNEYLNLRPSVLLVPISLGSTAKRLNLAEFDNDGTALMKPNVVRGLFGTVVESPRISGTRRYLFCDPGLVPAIKVVFLAGSGEAPVLEQQLGWRVDGIEWKARLDAKAQMFDPKGAVTNDGTP